MVNGGAAASVVNDLVDFLNDLWMVYYVMEVLVKFLEVVGYFKISESVEWGDLKRNGKYYVTRN